MGADGSLLGARVRHLRRLAGLTLEELSGRCGVSRSMISEIERGGRVPTVLVLDRIATALDTSIARLLGTETDLAPVHLRACDQDVAVDPGGWQRRVLSPVLPGVEFEFMRTTIDPGVDAGTFLPHAAGSREYLAVEAGTLRLTLDGVVTDVPADDSFFYPGDCQHGFANPGAEPCVYYLVMDLAGSPAPHRKA